MTFWNQSRNKPRIVFCCLCFFINKKNDEIDPEEEKAKIQRCDILTSIVIIHLDGDDDTDDDDL